MTIDLSIVPQETSREEERVALSFRSEGVDPFVRSTSVVWIIFQYDPNVEI